MLGLQRYQLKKPVFLIGYMACGKTTTANHLSKMTGQESIDIDKQIVFLQKRTITEIFNTHGVDKFRLYEHEVLKRVSDNLSFISTGGGCIDNPQNYPLLESNYCIFLNVDFDVIKSRIANSKAYPMYQSDNQGQELFNKRKPLYKRFADLTIECGTKDVSEICEEIRKKLLDDNVLIY